MLSHSNLTFCCVSQELVVRRRKKDTHHNPTITPNGNIATSDLSKNQEDEALLPDSQLEAPVYVPEQQVHPSSTANSNNSTTTSTLSTTTTGSSTSTAGAFPIWTPPGGGTPDSGKKVVVKLLSSKASLPSLKKR